MSSPTTWKESAGREHGDDGYIFGDGIRTVAQKVPTEQILDTVAPVVGAAAHRVGQAHFQTAESIADLQRNLLDDQEVTTLVLRAAFTTSLQDIDHDYVKMVAGVHTYGP